MNKFERLVHPLKTKEMKLAGTVSASMLAISSAIANADTIDPTVSNTNSQPQESQHVLSIESLPSQSEFTKRFAIENAKVFRPVENITIKEENILSTKERDTIRIASVALATGGLLIAEAMRRRQMEAARKQDRKLSIAGMGLRIAGTAGLLYTLWTLVDKF